MLPLPFAPPAPALQNPKDPYLLLSAGWRTVYYQNDLPGNPAPDGPKVGQIRVPPYGSGVEPAADVHKRDPKATYVATFLGGRAVEAALTADGSLTVSFGERKPHEHPSDSPASYNARVLTARDAAEAVGIILSRLGAPGREPAASGFPKRSPDRPAPRHAPPGDPFPGRLSLPEGYAYRREPWDATRYGRLVGDPGPTIGLFHDAGPAERPDPEDVKAKPMWHVPSPVLGGTLNVWGSDARTVAVRFDPAPGPSAPGFSPSFVGLEGTPKAAFVAIFAALTYDPPRG